MANIADLSIGVKVDDRKMVSDFEGITPKLATVAKAAGIAAGGALIAGALIGMEREAATDKLAAGLRLSEGEARQAGQVAGEVFATGITDSREMVGAAVQAIAGELGGLDSATPDLVTEALAFAQVFDTDVATAVGRAGVLFRTGLVADGEEAFDLLTAGMQEVAPSLRDELFDATQEYSRFFNDLGFSGEEMFALLAAADDKFELDKTGDAIKELSVRAADGSTGTVEAFELIGLNAEEMGDAVLAGGDVARDAFDEIVEGLLAVESPSARAQAAVALFGTPVEDLSSAQIPDFLESLQNLGGGMSDVEGRAEEMTDQFGNNAQTKIQGMKNKVTNFLSSVVEAPGALGTMATGVAGIGAAMEPLAPALTGLAIVFQGQLSAMAASMGGVVATVARHAGTFILSTARMGIAALISAGKVAAAWVIAMGPVGWVIAGVVALVALIVANWDTVKKWTKAAWEWVSEKIAAVWGWIKDVTSGAVTAVVGFFVNLRDKIVEAVTKARDWVIDRIKGLKDGAIDTVLDLLDWWKGLPGRLIEALGNLGTLLWDAGKSIVTGLWEGIKSMGGWLATKVAEWVTDKIPGPIASVLGISSPSKVTAGLGKEVAAGLALGMSKDLSLVEHSAMKLAAASIPGISGVSGVGFDQPPVPGLSPSGVSSARASQTTIHVGDVYGWDDFRQKVREAGVDINRLGWQG